MLLQQLKWLRSVLPILLLLLSGVCSYPAGSSRLRCYVCGGENENACGDISSTPPETSLKICPETAQGCLTQVEDKEVTRSCVDLKIADCKAANGKLYCYCDTEACNDKPASIGHIEDDDDIVPRHQIRNFTNGFQMDIDNLEKIRSRDCEEDDEDRCEGSGSQPEDRSDDHLIVPILKAMPTSTTTTSTSPSTTTNIATTEEDVTTSRPVPAETTTKSSLEPPTGGTSVMTATGTTSEPELEPSRARAFTSIVSLLIAAMIAVLFGNVWLLKD